MKEVVIDAFRQRFGHAPAGMDAVFGGDVPIAAGVSSSAAVEMAFILAWEALGNLSFDGTTRTRLGQRAQNGYLGVQSGIYQGVRSGFFRPIGLFRS
jgi:galactokinase